MKEFKWQALIIVVILFGSLDLAYSAPVESEDSQKGISASISTDNKELHQKLKEGCEIDAYIKQGDSKCEIKIRIKDDFKDSRRDDFQGDYYKPTPHDSLEIERAIYIHIPRDCISNNGEDCSENNSLPRDNTLCGDDRVNYITYKNESKISDVLQWHYLFRRLRKKDLDTEIINLGVTYSDFFQAVEELVVRDKTKLGKGTIYRTKIVFKEIKPDAIFMRLLMLGGISN